MTKLKWCNSSEICLICRLSIPLLNRWSSYCWFNCESVKTTLVRQLRINRATSMLGQLLKVLHWCWGISQRAALFLPRLVRYFLQSVDSLFVVGNILGSIWQALLVMGINLFVCARDNSRNLLEASCKLLLTFCNWGQRLHYQVLLTRPDFGFIKCGFLCLANRIEVWRLAIHEALIFCEFFRELLVHEQESSIQSMTFS